jgi:hypothetical protein
MTGLELLADGLEVRRSTRGIEYRCPSDRQSELQFQVAMRLELVGDAPEVPVLHREPSCCSVCCDPLENGRGGWCILCELARDKRLREKPSAPTSRVPEFALERDA